MKESTARRWLIAAALYNLIWGATVIVSPHLFFDWSGLARPRYPEIWQCVGMIVGVYGIGYAIAALDPWRHWPIVLAGFLGKILGPIGFAKAILDESFNWAFGVNIIFNDLIWWIPFFLILKTALQKNMRLDEEVSEAISLNEALKKFSWKGETLHELNSRQPITLLFLRHSGCTFCRKTLHELAKAEKENQSSNSSHVILIHMSTPSQFKSFLDSEGLPHWPHISDSEKVLYKAFGLQRASWRQIVNYKVLKQALLRGDLLRYGVGKLEGDGLQLGGIFLLKGTKVLCSQKLADVADSIQLSSWITR